MRERRVTEIGRKKCKKRKEWRRSVGKDEERKTKERGTEG